MKILLKSNWEKIGEPSEFSLSFIFIDYFKIRKDFLVIENNIKSRLTQNVREMSNML